nr:molybdopterin-binding protein [Opitutaceae bacterium]
MIRVADFQLLIDSLVPAPLPAERIPLAHATQRLLREPILADADQPAFHRSAFDGYLARLDQAPGPVTLLGTLPPGIPAPPSAPAPGHAWRILTGAAVPADAPVGIVMQEDTTRLPDGRIDLRIAPSHRLIRPRASQCRAGDLLLPAGSPLTPGAVALLASVGHTTPLVTRRPRVAHVVTGDELVPADTTPSLGQIRDTNSPLIAALVASAGAALVFQTRTGDDPATTLDTLRAALATSPDILLISGGASVGDHDHTAAHLRALGFAIHADKVASRPGKPFITASRG